MYLEVPEASSWQHKGEDGEASHSQSRAPADLARQRHKVAISHGGVAGDVAAAQAASPSGARKVR